MKLSRKTIIVNSCILLIIACFMFGNHYLANKFYAIYDIKGLEGKFLTIRDNDKKIPMRINNFYVNINNVDTRVKENVWADLLNSGKFTLIFSRWYVSFNHIYPTIGFDVKATRTDKTIIISDNFDEYKVSSWEKGLNFSVMSSSVNEDKATYRIVYNIKKKNSKIKSKFLAIYKEGEIVSAKEVDTKDNNAIVNLDLGVNTGVLEVILQRGEDINKILQILFDSLL